MSRFLPMPKRERGITLSRKGINLRQIFAFADFLIVVLLSTLGRGQKTNVPGVSQIACLKLGICADQLFPLAWNTGSIGFLQSTDEKALRFDASSPFITLSEGESDFSLCAVRAKGGNRRVSRQ